MNRFQYLATSIAFLGITALACAPKSGLELVSFNASAIEAPRDQSSPENVVENMALAYYLRDFELYERQLDPMFTVRFSRPTGSDEFGWSKGLTYEQELRATKQMFEDSSSIEFEMEYERPVPSTIEEFPATDGFWQLKVRDMTMRMSIEGTDDNYVVSDEQTLYVLKDVSTTGQPDWRAVLQQLYSHGDEPSEDDK